MFGVRGSTARPLGSLLSPLSVFINPSQSYRKWQRTGKITKKRTKVETLGNAVMESVPQKYSGDRKSNFQPPTIQFASKLTVQRSKPLQDPIFPSRPFEHTESPHWLEHPNGLPDDLIRLNNLKDNKGAKQKGKIVGRGIGSRLGKTCGRGQKGQGSRSGGSVRPGFIGGQTPLYKAVRKYGFTNRNQIDYQVLNLNRLQYALDTGRLVQPTDRPLNIQDLRKTILKGLNKPVKLLGSGKDMFKGPSGIPLNIEVQAVSKSAKEAITRAGGVVTTVYFNKLGLNTILKKPHDQITIKFAQVNQKKAHRYDAPRFYLDGTHRKKPEEQIEEEYASDAEGEEFASETLKD